MKKFILNYLWLLVRLKLRKNPTIIGITGSAGKTSTRSAIETILREKYNIISTTGNLNTEFGVAYVLLGQKQPESKYDWIALLCKSILSVVIPIENDTIVILELGADRPGDIRFFKDKLNINIAVLTNIGNAHLQNFESKTQLIYEKMQLMRSVRKSGWLIFNQDDKILQEQTKLFPVDRKINFGLSGDCKISAIKYNLSGIKCRISTQKNSYDVQLPAINQTLFWSIAPAVLIGELLNLSVRQIEKGLKKYKIENGRGAVLVGIKNTTLIDHSYNANPTSMQAVIEGISKLSTKRKKIAILGDMKELGEASKKEHEKIGIMAKGVFNKIYGYGEEAKYYYGETYSDRDELCEIILKEIREGDIILFMGSQATRLEKIIIKLLAHSDSDSSRLVRQSKVWKNL